MMSKSRARSGMMPMEAKSALRNVDAGESAERSKRRLQRSVPWMWVSETRAARQRARIQEWHLHASQAMSP